MDPRGLLREHGGDELVERLEHLDRTFGKRAIDAKILGPGKSDALDADVVVIGGGLSLLIAAEVARLGKRVVVLERARAGAVHREWNASAPELRPLVESGIVEAGALQELVIAAYDTGVCHFHGHEPRVVRGVLDRAVDAAALLGRVREVAEARGVRFIDRASVTAIGASDHGARVRFGGDELTARIAVDARGASSPYASADLMCPTVGGVIGGLDFDPTVGDILVTTEHAERGRQHIWEGFPGRPGELTTYLFYYAERKAVPRDALMQLYARFFTTLASYRQGTPELVRPTFGYIPGWSRLVPAPTGPHPRIVLVGDAAARHSPLTFCGFGSMLRSFQRVAKAIARSCSDSVEPLYREEPIHSWTGLLARVMASEALEGPALNELLDSAFESLALLGNASFAALLQDRMPAREFIRFLHSTSKRFPGAYRKVLGALGPAPMARWGLRLGAHLLAGAP